MTGCLHGSSTAFSCLDNVLLYLRCTYLGCKMHHCVNLFCVQNVAQQIPALYVTLDELQHNIKVNIVSVS